MGEDNHWLFLQLCFYTQVLSLFTLVMDFCQYYYFQPLTALDQVLPSTTVFPLFQTRSLTEIQIYFSRETCMQVQIHTEV